MAGRAPDDFLPFALPSIGEDEISEVCNTLRSGWLTTGPKTREFEQQFAEFIGVSEAIAVNSATAGLHLALEAMRIGPGDKVVTTPYTFTATAEVIRYLGADPVFVDVDPLTFNISPVLAEQAVAANDAVKALLPVHFAGQAADLDPLLECAKGRGIPVLEDAAHALPTTYKGRTIGTIGDATVFSFYATKTIATGEGGMVTTDNAEFAKRIRTMRLHGISRDVFDRYTSSKPSWYYEVVAPGFKYNLTDVAASLGIHQLRKAEEFRRRREAIAGYYDRELADLPVDLPHTEIPEDTHAWHLYVIRLRLADIGLDRNAFIEAMAEHGVGTSVHFIPLHKQPYWRDRYGLDDKDFPVASALFDRVVSLPIYPGMSDADCERVVSAMRRILA